MALTGDRLRDAGFLVSVLRARCSDGASCWKPWKSLSVGILICWFCHKVSISHRCQSCLLYTILHSTISMSIYTHTYKYIQVCVYNYTINIHAHTHTCIHTYMHAYIHTAFFTGSSGPLGRERSRVRRGQLRSGVVCSRPPGATPDT